MYYNTKKFRSFYKKIFFFKKFKIFIIFIFYFIFNLNYSFADDNFKLFLNNFLNEKVLKNYDKSIINDLRKNSDFIKRDILLSKEIFKKKLGKNSDFFSYPFGEYSLEFKKIIKDLGFLFAFGQHSGVIDETKDLWELPRFPINEKYGEISRFNTLMKTLPFKYKSISPEDKYLLQAKNPPKVIVKFHDNIKNLQRINCFSNEGNKWRNSKILFIENNTLEIEITEKFIGERGRINCSLKESNGFWRWLGVQYVISER